MLVTAFDLLMDYSKLKFINIQNLKKPLQQHADIFSKSLMILYLVLKIMEMH